MMVLIKNMVLLMMEKEIYLHAVMNKDWVQFEKGNEKVEEKIPSGGK